MVLYLFRSNYGVHYIHLCMKAGIYYVSYDIVITLLFEYMESEKKFPNKTKE